jgi:hypothetical protein
LSESWARVQSAEKKDGVCINNISEKQ